MDGLVPGRVVYFVFSHADVENVRQHRRMTMDVGNEVKPGDICPAIVTRVLDPADGLINCKVQLDGDDTYWATSVKYVRAETPTPHSFHWMFAGQDKRYEPQSVRGVDPAALTRAL
jgi:hypothetical protein